MDDNRRSLSLVTRAYDELQQILTIDQLNEIFPLINSAVASNEMDDEEIARQHQEQLYRESIMNVDEPSPINTPTFNPRRLVNTDDDAEMARRMQEQEYSRNSIVPTRPYKLEVDYKNPFSRPVHSGNAPVLSDAQLAAHLQAEENRRGRFRSPRLSHRTVQVDSPEVIPMPFSLQTSQGASSSNQFSNNISHLHQIIASRGRGRTLHVFPRGGNRRNRDLQNNNADFGPDDYERLSELDCDVKTDSLTKEQINRLPTEKFQRPRNQTDEENKCNICWDIFEQNQILRRLPCLHVYHKDCIDKWLKEDKNQCPVCRIAPIT